jgi:heme exporter protein A
MQIKANNLAIERGGRIVFSKLSFTLGAGECLLVTGPNGAGKSTLLRAIAGLLSPSQGTISCEPCACETVQELIHYVGHTEALKPALTPAENLAFWAAILRTGTGATPVAEALSAFGLGHVAELPTAYLSAGQKRRVALARLLVARRPIWLLDEPSTALDTHAQQLVTKAIVRHINEGGLVMAATHMSLGLEARTLKLGAGV